LLQLGDCGKDVRTLNWILKAEESRRVEPTETFARPTDVAVRKVQRRAGLRRSGVVNAKTRKALVKRMRRGVATWYGPGFFGNRTACGSRLKKKTIGVAHRKLPCGTNVTVAYRGRFVRARVIDRGPYAHGASWDLTQATARKLHMRATSKIRVAVIR
jgi:rare lipoprotein A (peptidoglycan hydrolase)